MRKGKNGPHKPWNNLVETVQNNRAKPHCFRLSYRCAQDEESVGAAYYPDLLEMLGVSDFFVVLCPLTPDTHHLISKPHLAAMKPTAILVKTARGELGFF